MVKGSSHADSLIIARLKSRREQAKLQGELIKTNDLLKETIRAKLEGRFDGRQYLNFERCGQEKIFRTCRECHQIEEFTYRCNIKWCPVCQWRLVKKRQQLLQIWATKIKQPKHLVLTQKNFPILTRKKIREHTRALARMRRTDCFSTVKGGSVSVEITNEENGWHLHSHWLIDVRWLDMEKVSQAWAQQVGQEFSIVKIMDVREKQYQQEVTKYVVEGSELAKWPAEHIVEFVSAIKGRRFFFTFGSLRGFAVQVREELEFQKPEVVPCGCGETRFSFQTEADQIFEEARSLGKRRARANASPSRAQIQQLDDNRRTAAQPVLPALV